MDATQLTQAIGGVRAGVGAALVLMPGVSGRIWIGPGAGDGGAKVLARAVGARDVVLGVRTLEAAGDGDRAALWLHLGYLASAADVAGAVLGWRNLSPVRRVLVPVAAGAVGVAGYQAWRMLRSADGEPSTGEVLGEDLAEPTSAGSSNGSSSSSASTSAGSSSPSSGRSGTATLQEARILSLEEAAAELGAPPEQVEAMVEEGLIEPESTDPLTFRASVVQAAHLAGG